MTNWQHNRHPAQFKIPGIDILVRPCKCICNSTNVGHDLDIFALYTYFRWWYISPHPYSLNSFTHHVRKVVTITSPKKCFYLALVGVAPLRKTLGVVKNSRQCVHSIGFLTWASMFYLFFAIHCTVFRKSLFTSYVTLHIYIYIYI